MEEALPDLLEGGRVRLVLGHQVLLHQAGVSANQISSILFSVAEPLQFGGSGSGSDPSKNFTAPAPAPGSGSGSFSKAN